jgi:hypothetical protein
MEQLGRWVGGTAALRAKIDHGFRMDLDIARYHILMYTLSRGSLSTKKLYFVRGVVAKPLASKGLGGGESFLRLGFCGLGFYVLGGGIKGMFVAVNHSLHRREAGGGVCFWVVG